VIFYLSLIYQENLQVSKKSLSKDGTFKYCRSATSGFNNEVENILEAYGNICIQILIHLT
jgi:hypothetical protein